MEIKVENAPKKLIDAAGRAYVSFCDVLSFIRNPKAKADGTFPSIPDGFVPETQFLVCSDIHNRFDRFRDMFAMAREQLGGTANEKIDAVLVAGDFTDSGKSEDIKDFYDAVLECCGSKTVPVVCLGNHEYHSSGADVRERYEKITGWTPEVHKVINGLHFIGVSYSDVETFDRKTQSWMTGQFDIAHADTPRKPIFVIQHPHPTATVYGSVNWGQKEILKPLKRYPNIINFSGHSHYPVNDPRSIYQGGFTAVGAGGLKYYELEMNLNAGFFPEEEESQGNFWIVGVDKNGAVALRAYDTYSGGAYESIGYYIEKPWDKASFRYTHRNFVKAEGKPTFPAGAKITIERDENGDTFICFPKAADRFIVHDYGIKVTKNGKTVYRKTVLSDYYYRNEPDTYKINVGKLTGTGYKFSVIACNAYYKESKVLKASL